jgi:hypothetical protein
MYVIQQASTQDPVIHILDGALGRGLPQLYFGSSSKMLCNGDGEAVGFASST